jgi:hypothetical protein
MEENRRIETVPELPEDDRDRAIRAALKSGHSFEDVVREFAPAAEDIPRDELAMRASLVTRFDERIYREELARGLTAPPFDEFVKRPYIEPVPRSPAEYRVSDEGRREWLKPWPESERTAFRKRLMVYYGNLGPGAEMDVLAQQIQAAPADALGQIHKLFGKADASFDLAQFEALLNLVSTRTDSEYSALWGAQYRRLKARSLFVDEYYQTLLFYARPKAVTKINELLAADSPHWIMSLYAAGGIGKTMFLRWLVARDLVERRKVPVAYVDLDDHRLDMAARYPWLLWLPILQQWKEQIVETGVESVFMSYRKFWPLLIKGGGDSSKQNPLLKTRQLEDEFVAAAPSMLSTLRALTYTLNQVSGTVALVIDTAEEASLHRPQILVAEEESEKQDNPGMVDILAELHKDCRNLRFIMAGRYNFTEPQRLPGYDRYMGVTAVYPLGKFEDDDAGQYLRTKRHLHQDDLVQAITGKSEGVPFRVSLLADLTLSGALKTAPEIREANEDVEYLIDRVVKRIPEPEVRWIVRYGVIPRRLNKEFVAEVMLVHLKREMESSQADRPDPRYWTAATPDPDAGWLQLRKYASSYGWVKMVDDGLQFGPEVRNPLRRILRQEQVFSLLHHDAANWYARKAEQDPDNWVRWKTEELYHLTQLDGTRGMEQWRRLLAGDEPPGLAARWSIAQLVFDRDFLQAGTEDAPAPGAAIIAEAHFELASVAAQEGAVEPDARARADKWTAARREFEAGKRRESAAGKPVISPVRRALIECAILMSEGKYDAALSIQRYWLSSETDPQYRIAFMVQHGAALFEMGRDGTDILAEAREWARGMAQPWILPAQISRRLVAELIPRYDLVRLRSVYRGLINDLPSGLREYRAEVLNFVLQTYLPAGDLGAISTLFRSGSFDPTDHPFAAAYTRAEVALRSLHLETAQKASEQARLLSQRDPDNGYWSATCWEQEGRIAAAGLNQGAAIEALTRAKGDFEAANSIQNSAICKMRMSDAVFEISGDTGLALSYLFDITEQQLQIEPFLRTLWLSRKMRLHLARGEDGELKATWDDLTLHLNSENHPGFRVMGWTAGLVVGLADAETVTRLGDGLYAIQPPSARIPLVEFCRWTDHSYARLDGLPELPEPERGSPHWAMQQIQVADYERACGRRETAAARLQRTWEALGNDVTLPIWSSLVRAEHRLGMQVEHPVPLGEGALLDIALLESSTRVMDPALLESLALRYRGTAFEARARQLQGKVSDAIAIYQRLGLKPQADALSTPTQASAHAPEAPTHLIDLQITGGHIQAVFSAGNVVLGMRELAPEISQQIVFGGFEDLATALLARAYDLALEYLVMEGLAPGGVTGKIALQVPTGRVPAWPWEQSITPLTRKAGLQYFYRRETEEQSQRELVRWAQRVLQQIHSRRIVVDGICGPMTRAAIQHFQNQLGIEPTGLLNSDTCTALSRHSALSLHSLSTANPLTAIVLPSRELEHKFGRGYGFAGIDLEAIWHAAGCRTETIQFSPQLLPTIAAIQPDILHIATILEDMRGEVRLLGEKDSLRGRELAGLLREARTAGRPPFVVLDPPRPDSDHAAYHQLVLRNSLSDDLFRQGASGVLACGLAPFSDLLRIAQACFQALHGASMGDAARVWWESPLLVNMPAALFCHDPSLPAWYGGREWDSPTNVA